MTDDVDLVTVDEAARRLSLSRMTIYTLIRNGDLDGVKIGKSRRVTTTSIRDYVKLLSSTGGTARTTDPPVVAMAGARRRF